MNWKSVVKLLPRYGNWGGPGWSCGKFVEDPNKTDWSVSPRDSLDALFKEHDRLYQQTILNVPIDEWENSFNEADALLAEGAYSLPSNPSRWPSPPTTASWIYAYVYRKMIILIFSITKMI